jgi:DNA repair protein RecO (recombination protein O)
MLETTRGIVLHSQKYSEGSLIVNIFTESHGNLGFIVKIPKSRTSSLRTVFLRPLSILEIVFDYRPNLSLQRITEIRLAVSYQTLPFDPLKETMALFLSEFLYYALRNEQPSISLFSYLTNGLEWLDMSRKEYSNFHLVFLLRLTRFLGFWPNVENYHEDDFFDLLSSQYTRVRPPHGFYLIPEEACLVPLFLRMSYPTMRLFRMNHVQRGRFLDVLNSYYRLHIPDFPVLKSVAVLRDVLS